QEEEGIRDLRVTGVQTCALPISAANQAGIELRDEIGDDLPPVLADAEKLQRVLVNLVGNAIKLSRRGGVVTVTAQQAPIRRPFQIGRACVGKEGSGGWAAAH